MHVVATAGHVDHGKSTLVRALTGMRGLLDDLTEVDTAGTPPLAENRMLRHAVERILTQLDVI